MEKRTLNTIAKFIFAEMTTFAFATIILFERCRGYESLSFINTFLYGCVGLSVLVIALLTVTLLLKKQYRMSTGCLLIVIMYAEFFMASILNGNVHIRRGFLANVFMVIYFDIILYTRDSISFRGSVHGLTLLALLNLVSVTLQHNTLGFLYHYRTGAWRNKYYLLGYDNGHIVTMFPAIMLNLEIYLHTKKKKYLWIAILLSLSSFIVDSKLSIMMEILTVAIIVVRKHFPLIKKLFMNKWVWIAGMLAATFIIAIMNRFGLFSEILVSLVGKDLESTGRSMLYPIAVSYIKKNPIIGYGYVVDDSWIGGFNCPHNVILDYLLMGGIIALFLYLLILYRSIRKAENHIKKGYNCTPLLSGVLAYLFCSLGEGYETYSSYYLFWWMCLAISHYDSFESLAKSYCKKTRYRIRSVHFYA